MSHHVSTMLSEEDDSYYDHMCLIFDQLGIIQPPCNECAKTDFIMHAITQGSVHLVACDIASLMGNINQSSNKHNMKKIFLRQLPFSNFLTTTLKLTKNCNEKFLKKKFAVWCLGTKYKFNTHNINGVRNYVNNPNCLC